MNMKLLGVWMAKNTQLIQQPMTEQAQKKNVKFVCVMICSLQKHETIERGAFAQSLANNDEVHALFNHDDDKLLGRRGAGTLKLWEDDHGLRMELNPPNTTLGNDVVELLRRNDLVSMSFGFFDVDDTWEVRDGKNIRTINRARLFDVSIVVSPAYSGSSVSMAQRSLEQFQSEKAIEQTNFDAVGERITMNLRIKLAEQE